MVSAAPVRVLRKSTLSSPLVKAANKIVTSPTFNRAKTIDFDKKNEYDRFIKFIQSSNRELLRIKIPTREEIAKRGADDGGKKSGFPVLQSLIGADLLRRLLRRLRKSMPKWIKRPLIRLKRLIRNILKPFRQLRRFIQSIPSKIRKFADDGFKTLSKYFDDAIIAIKNLPKAKWITNLITKGKNLLDDGVKLGKEFLTNSKVIQGAQKIVKKASPKLASMGLGEITVIGGIVADVSAGFYRLKKGDKTGAALSFLSAIPLIGLPVAAVDIARDFNAFDDDSTFLGKLDFLDWLKTNKDNPNYKDTRTDEQKQIDEDLDAYLKEEYINDIKEKLENLKGVQGKDAQRKRMGLTRELRDFQKKDLTSTQLRTVTKDLVDFELFGPDAASHNDIQKFLDNVEKSESVSTESLLSENVTTLIDNSQTFLLPVNDGSESMFNSSGTSAPPVIVNTSIVEFDYSKVSDAVSDELLFLKLDK